MHAIVVYRGYQDGLVSAAKGVINKQSPCIIDPIRQGSVSIICADWPYFALYISDLPLLILT